MSMEAIMLPCGKEIVGHFGWGYALFIRCMPSNGFTECQLFLAGIATEIDDSM
jgi:hypothetical protein